LSLNGDEYLAQYLSQEEVDIIVNSERERGLVVAEGSVLNNSTRNTSGQRQSLQDCLMD